MRLDLRADATGCALAAARALHDALEADQRIGVATGDTFVPVYERVVAMRPATRSPALYLLDEYVGLEPGDPSSFRETVARLLCRPLGLADASLHGPLDEVDRGLDPAECARRYDERVGSLDLVLLGIGANGHIAFNEPGSPLASTTRLVRLREDTRSANARAFPGRSVPTRAATMGVATILRARRVVLVATGARKAPALAAALTGPVSPDLPASALRGHPDATVVADPGAARLLPTSTPHQEERS